MLIIIMEINPLASVRAVDNFNSPVNYVVLKPGESIPPATTQKEKKTNFLNYSDSKDSYTVPYQLRTGSQSTGEVGSLSFVINEKTGRITIPKDIRDTEATAEALVLRQMRDGTLEVSHRGRIYGRFSREQLEEGKIQFKIGETVLAVTRFNPDTRTIEVYRDTTDVSLPPVIPPVESQTPETHLPPNFNDPLGIKQPSISEESITPPPYPKPERPYQNRPPYPPPKEPLPSSPETPPQPNLIQEIAEEIAPRVKKVIGEVRENLENLPKYLIDLAILPGTLFLQKGLPPKPTEAHPVQPPPVVLEVPRQPPPVEINLPPNGREIPRQRPEAIETVDLQEDCVDHFVDRLMEWANVDEILKTNGLTKGTEAYQQAINKITLGARNIIGVENGLDKGFTEGEFNLVGPHLIQPGDQLKDLPNKRDMQRLARLAIENPDDPMWKNLDTNRPLTEEEWNDAKKTTKFLEEEIGYRESGPKSTGIVIPFKL